MKNIIYILVFSLGFFAAPRQTSLADPELDLDLQTLIAGIKHFDAAVTSGKGEFVYEHRIRGEEKRAYAFTFAGSTFENAQVRVDYDSDTSDHVLSEIYDGERQWEVYKKRTALFSVDITSDDYKRLNTGETELPTSIKQLLEKHDIHISAEVRIQPHQASSYSKMVDTVTGNSHDIYYTEEYFTFYEKHLEYGARPGTVIHAHLDPRYWMTFGKATPSSYLMTPLWKVLETHESEILQTENHNGEAIYLISVEHPTVKTLKLWISPERGFRVVKLQSMFVSHNEAEWSVFKNGVHYLKERVLHYREYQPGLWLPEKVEETIHPLFAADPEKKGDRLVKTTLQAVSFQLNVDVSNQFQLDVPEDTLVYDYGVAKERPFRELKQTSQ